MHLEPPPCPTLAALRKERLSTSTCAHHGDHRACRCRVLHELGPWDSDYDLDHPHPHRYHDTGHRRAGNQLGSDCRTCFDSDCHSGARSRCTVARCKHPAHTDRGSKGPAHSHFCNGRETKSSQTRCWCYENLRALSRSRNVRANVLKQQRSTNELASHAAWHSAT